MMKSIIFYELEGTCWWPNAQKVLFILGKTWRYSPKIVHVHWLVNFYRSQPILAGFHPKLSNNLKDWLYTRVLQ